MPTRGKIDAMIRSDIVRLTQHASGRWTIEHVTFARGGRVGQTVLLAAGDEGKAESAEAALEWIASASDERARGIRRYNEVRS